MTSKSYAQAVINGSGDKSKVSAYVDRGIEPATELSKKWKRARGWLEEKIRELECRVERLELQLVAVSQLLSVNSDLGSDIVESITIQTAWLTQQMF